MNICIVTGRYPYQDNMEFVFVKKLVDEWAKMGHHCVVVTSFSLSVYLRGRQQYRPYHYSYYVDGGNSVDVYCPRTWTIGMKVGEVSFDWWLSTRVFNRLMAKLSVPFDAIYCHFFDNSLRAFSFASRKNIPFFVATGESEIVKLYKPSLSFTWDNYKEKTTGVIAVSSKNKNEGESMGYLDSAKCEVFPNGTDLNVFKPLKQTHCRDTLKLPADKFIICCVGYLCKRKGQDRVLAAIRKLNNPNIKAVFLGKGFTNQADFNLDGEEVLYVGTAENSQLPIYLGASDVFCLPTQHEGCCNAVIEAMACGKAIISSDRAFNHDVLNKDNSILVDPDNIDEIAEAISKLYNDRQFCNDISDRVLNDAQALGIKQRAENIFRFMQDKMIFE